MRKNRVLAAVLAGCMALGLLAGCSGKKNGAQPPAAVPVKAIQVIQQDTPVVYDFVGEVEARDQVQIQSKVAGMLVEKMVSGGTRVHAGQPLFRIDRRVYESDVLSKKGSLAQAEAALTALYSA